MKTTFTVNEIDLRLNRIIYTIDVKAESKQEAVRKAFAAHNDENYFPNDDGTVTDCDGDVIMDADQDYIDFRNTRWECD